MEDHDGLELEYDAFAEGPGGYSARPNYGLPVPALQADFKPWLGFSRPKDRLQGKMDDAIRRSRREDDQAIMQRWKSEYDDLKGTIPELDARIGAALTESQALPPEMSAPRETMGEGIAQIIANLMGMPVGQVVEAKNKRMTERRDREFGNAVNKYEAGVRNAQASYRELQGEKANTLRRMEGLQSDVEGIEKFWRDFDAEVDLGNLRSERESANIAARGEQERKTAALKQELAAKALRLKDELGSPEALFNKLMDIPGMTPDEATRYVVSAYEMKAASADFTKAKTETENQMRPGRVRGQNVLNRLRERQIVKTDADIGRIRAGISRDDAKLELSIQKFLNGETDDPPKVDAAIMKYRTTQRGNKARMQAIERQIQAFPKKDRTDEVVERIGELRKEQDSLRVANDGLEERIRYLNEVREESKSPKALAPSGAYSYPVSGSVSSRFGHRTAPKAGASTNHGGMDFAVPSGTPVKAARDGVVIRVQGNVGNAGDIIVVRHRDGSTTHYFHLSGFSVKAGQQVKQGQVIGKSGATGNVTGPHLHFEIRDSKGNKINPGKILK